jgi:APA family basic amino acid/polyamine antiporter
MGKLNSHGVPAVASIIGSAWACVLCLSGTYGNLLDYVVFAVLLFYIFTIIGIFILRRKMPDVPREYKAFGYPVLPVIYLLLVTLICIILLIYKTSIYLAGAYHSGTWHTSILCFQVQRPKKGI